ncbi:MAG: 4Fe-4S dicluster domain-containing protein [Candidatus Hydrogenedentes bacterium]|nr:4Fe-4S dicluster domain-containing protein [Candidatus Hydrogenedentota bacterium]
MIEELRQKARELLESGEVDLVIGYGQGSDPTRTMPVFIRRPEDCDQLVWNKHCYNNLTSYLTWPELKTRGKRAVVCKGCDAKTIVVLCTENQINRDDVVVIGLSCEGVGNPLLSKCEFCDVRTPGIYDILIGPELPPLSKDNLFEDVRQVEARDAAERWEFWREQFSGCIKCYACRQACPLCYCTQCIVERNQPQWVPTSSHPKGNFAWNVVRAMHLAGRCIGCGECERVCPSNIPLMLANKKLAQVVEEQFKYESGYDIDVPLPMVSFMPDDSDELFK